MQNVAWHCPPGISREVPDKDIVWMAAYVAPKLVCTIGVNGTVTGVQVTHAMGTSTPPYHHRHCLMNFALVTIRVIHFLFTPEDTMPMISKMWTHQTTAPLPQSILDELRRREVGYG